jgi:hypothetical protein
MRDLCLLDVIPTSISTVFANELNTTSKSSLLAIIFCKTKPPCSICAPVSAKRPEVRHQDCGDAHPAADSKGRPEVGAEDR